MSESSPMISVIIPAFNYAQYLDKAISSVLSQTYSDFELIVVDDGSEDDTEQVVKKFRDPRLHYYWQQNQGLSAARNTGIRLARGAFIAFLDADDEWYPEKLSKQIQVILPDDKIGLVYCHCEYFDNQGEIKDKVTNRRRGDLFLPLIRGNFLPGTSSAMLVRCECFEALGGFSTELSACEDWHMIIRIASKWHIDFADEVLVRIRTHPGSMSRNIERQEANAFKTITLLEKEYSDRVPQKVWKQARSYSHLAVGRVHGLNQDFSSAQRSFIDALKTDPTNFHALIFLLSTSFGPRFYPILKKLKRLVVPEFGI